MASGFYHVPRVPLSPSQSPDSGSPEAHASSEDTSPGAHHSDPEEDRRREERQREAQRHRRRLSLQGGIRSSTTLPIIHEVVDGRKSSKDRDRRYNIVYRDGRIHLVEESEPTWYERHPILPAPAIKLFVLISAVLFFTAALVCLCLFTKSMTVAGSDSYVGLMASLWWIVFVLAAVVVLLRLTLGAETVPLALPPLPTRQLAVSVLLFAMFLLLLFVTSLPWRVSPRLQMVLMALHIPFSSLANYVIFHKGINCKQVCCLLVLCAGIFVTIEPSFLTDNSSRSPGIPGDDRGPDRDTDRETDHIESVWYHALLHALCWLPFSFWLIHSKKMLSKHEANFVSLLAWTTAGAFLLLFCLFWINFIPNFGQVESVWDYWLHVQAGVLALYGGSADVQVSASLLIIFFAVALLLYHILCTLEEPHMVCYSVALTAGVSGLGTIFWTLFSPLPNMTLLLGLTNTGVFTLVGVVVTVISAVGYAHFEGTSRGGDGDEDDDFAETVAITSRGSSSLASRQPRYNTFASSPGHGTVPVRSVHGKPPPTPARTVPRVRSSSDPAPMASPMSRTKSAPVIMSM